MNYNDFHELGRVLFQGRKNFVNEAGSDCIQVIVEQFKKVCSFYTPKFKPFIEYAKQQPECLLGFDTDIKAASSQVSRRCHDLTKMRPGSHGDFLALVLMFLWKNSDNEIKALLRSVKNKDNFVDYFLSDSETRSKHTKRGIMDKNSFDKRLRVNMLDWEIANRRICAERDKIQSDPSHRTRIALSKLFIDSLPTEAFHLKNVKDLLISNTLFDTIDGFSCFKELEVFDCSYNNISSIDELCVDELKLLYCGVTNVSSLANIARAAKLKKLYCGSTYVHDLTPLEHCKQLDLLCCEDTKVSSLSGLENCVAMTYIDCSDTDVSNLLPISKLPNLKEIVLSGCNIDSSLREFVKAPALECILFYKGSAQGVPAEILSRDSNENCLGRLKRFFSQTE